MLVLLHMHCTLLIRRGVSITFARLGAAGGPCSAPPILTHTHPLERSPWSHPSAGLRREVKLSLKDYERERALYIETVQAYLHIDRVLERLDAGQAAPAGASPRERVLWIWRCYIHYWVFRCGGLLLSDGLF